MFLVCSCGKQPQKYICLDEAKLQHSLSVTASTAMLDAGVYKFCENMGNIKVFRISSDGCGIDNGKLSWDLFLDEISGKLTQNDRRANKIISSEYECKNVTN